MCKQTLRRVYCAAHDRFARYEREPTRIGIAPLRKLRARHTATVRFSISKVSSVTVQVFDKHGLELSSRPRAAPRRPRDRVDAAVTRALPAADRGTGSERSAWRRDSQDPRRPPQAEAEKALRQAQATWRKCDGKLTPRPKADKLDR